MLSDAIVDLLEQYGHGHIYKTTSGLLARCGGPALCEECALERELVKWLLDHNKITKKKVKEGVLG